MINPFKPGSGLYPPYFAGRVREIEIFAGKLTQTIAGTPMHMAIIGDWATGKTSLLKKFREVAEHRDCFVSEIISPVTDSTAIFVDTLSNTIADDVRRKDGPSRYQKIKERLQGVEGMGVSAFGFGASVRKSKLEKASPQFNLHVGLRTVWESMSSRYNAIVLLIDDFDLITNDNMVLREIMVTYRNSLMEAINDDVKIMCVVAGTKLFEQFEYAHGPLVRFFEPFELKNLERDEAKVAITEPLKESEIKFTDEVVEKILGITHGQPYYIQEFCYVLCENAINNIVDKEIFEAVYNKILHDLARKMWRQRLYELGDVSIKVLYLVAKGYNTSEEILSQSRVEFDLKPNNVRVTLTRLQQTGHISRVSRGEYDVNDKLFGEYVTTLFSLGGT
jgi:hypothetical protein